MNVINNIIARLGRKEYKIDKSLSKNEIVAVLIKKGFSLARGFLVKFTLRESKGLLFVGRRCTLMFRKKISLGKSVFLGDDVEINALSKHGVVIGNNVSILKNTIIECTGVIRNLGEGITIGNDVGIAQNCFIQVRGSVYIGNHVIFGPGVSLFSENHVFVDPDLPVSVQGETRKGVTISDGVWIGARSVILDGVSIGKNSIVAAGSIVNQNVPEYAVVAGVPAKIIKSRK